MTTQARAAWLLFSLAMVAALTALAALTYRYRVERRNLAAGIALEMQVVEDIAYGSGLSVSAALAKLKSVGLRGVTVDELTVRSAIEAGLLRFQPDGSVTGEPRTVRQLEIMGAARFTPEAVSRPAANTIAFPGIRRDALLSLSIGLDAQASQDVKQANLQLIARIQNPPGLTPAYLNMLLSTAKRMGADIYLPTGEQVLGQRKLISETAASLRSLGILYASPEFAKLGGEAALARLLPDRTVRLHSIQAAEIDKAQMPEVLDRFGRAFRERNIRWLLLRPWTAASADPLSATMQLVSSVSRAVTAEGGTVGVPHPFAEPGTPRPLLLAVGLLSALAAAFALSLMNLPKGLIWAAAVGLLLLAGACWSAQGRQYMATATAIAFPVAAYVFLTNSGRKHPLLDYVLVSLISIAGGLCVAALLSELPYMVRVKQFFAVKLAHFLPILLVGLYLAARSLDWKRMLRSPITWLGASLGLIALIAIGLMFARTGNDNPAAVSDLELRARAVLDAVLYARPRTKEFMFGHPALLLGLLLGAYSLRIGATERYRVAVFALLTLGAIGQTSIVNTLCHIHTPLDVNLPRIAIGLVLGALVGGLLWLLAKTTLPKPAGAAP